MTNFLCSVSGKFPENYLIGLRANLWGVEEKYERRIAMVNKGDLLVFAVGGFFRSIHRVEGESFYDETPLWPEKEGSLFPHRIRISDPIMKGVVTIKDIANKISFMRGKQWGGTIQGANGVFNDRLTDDDMAIIKERMNEATPIREEVKIEEHAKLSERQTALFKFHEKDIEDRISDVIREMGLDLFQDENGRMGRQYPADRGRIDQLCKDVSSGQLVVIELKKGEAPNETLLQILRYMSWVKQNITDGRDVRGIILTEAADSSLVGMLEEVPNVEIKYYRVTIELITPGQAQSSSGKHLLMFL